jgi:hypothetical protein
MERKKAGHRSSSSADQPAYATAGEQVFGDNADDILTEKIMERTRENASGPSSSNPDGKTERKISQKTGVIGGLAIFAVVAGAALLLIRALFKASGRKGSR